MRDHGGDLDRARARFGGDDWIDLSTGINPVAYPVPDVLPARALAALPTAEDIAGLADAARRAYATSLVPVPLAGAQAAIQIVPRLSAVGRARVLVPTYNEHAGALAASGWQVAEVREPDALEGADLAVVVSPNNPDGRRASVSDLVALAGRVGLLVVDESFADPEPESALSRAEVPENVVILRSFGKFYGLAGLRLGFALAAPDMAARIAALAGPWAVSGPAIAIGTRALGDTAWRDETRARLRVDAARLDGLAEWAGWRLVGGTPLFRTYETGDAASAQERLARARIWSRIFPYSEGWMRLGLPGDAAGWARLETALSGGGE
ncbi:threonine-phosphate decarboxylase [Alphaproteobacteria bacterium GH1-50]|uniref:threonine-phosphate decarboxylase n=1 Tax=Kangsaoukella pontilimi TaxID=2691042 RepID=A0A7C9IHG8_9RHOB|nr:threonine-phosphate decarboxylase CobD [Kangsaoukella pontilimi]MXQ09048.1 threonine-phosphate decarboxylase [Kangsaoukella pontilimi]